MRIFQLELKRVLKPHIYPVLDTGAQNRPLRLHADHQLLINAVQKSSLQRWTISRFGDNIKV